MLQVIINYMCTRVRPCLLSHQVRKYCDVFCLERLTDFVDDPYLEDNIGSATEEIPCILLFLQLKFYYRVHEVIIVSLPYKLNFVSRIIALLTLNIFP